MRGRITYQGHASIRLEAKTGEVIYIDPYAGDKYDLPADAVLMSHIHPDHCTIDKVTLKPDALIVRHTDLLKDGVYQKLFLNRIGIKGVPAYNERHPKENGFVGFIIELDDVKIYIASDTSKIPEMNDLKAMSLDYAFLPCDGFYNMDVNEASECAAIIGAKHTVPYHTCRKEEGDFSEETALQLQANGKIILKPGESIEL